MHRNIFKFYLTLFSLSLILSGCYTLLNDPLKLTPKPQVDIHNLEKQDSPNEINPMVNRRYELRESVRRQRWLQRPYLHRYDGYYPIDPYHYNSYNTHSTHHIHDIPRTPASQVPPQQIIKVEVKETPSSRDVEKARMVWERRVNPSRARKIPTPTRRQKDGE